MAEDSRASRLCTPKLRRFTPWRRSSSRVAGLSWPGAHSDGDLGCGADPEVLAKRAEDAADVRGREEAGGSAAEIDGVDVVGEMSSERLGTRACVRDLSDEPVHVGGHPAGRECVRGEVAEAALGAAERNGEVEPEGVHAPLILSWVTADRIRGFESGTSRRLLESSLP